MNNLDPKLLKSIMMGDYRASADNAEHKSDKKSIKNKSSLKIIDLHAEKLFQGTMPSAEKILEKQLETLFDFIALAFSQRQHFVTAIHGKGEGILKKTIYQKLAHHPNVKSVKCIDDNPYFGGASKIYLR